MRGHEYARRLLRDMLEEHVPARLAVILHELGELDPEAPRAYLLADTLPQEQSLYPLLLVQSTSLAAFKQTDAGVADGYELDYSLRVVVAAKAELAKGYELSSVARDRLLLAVRESMFTHKQLANDAVLMMRTYAEDTGASMEDLQGRPLALGQIDITVRVYEQITDISAAQIAAAEVALRTVDSQRNYA